MTFLRIFFFSVFPCTECIVRAARARPDQKGFTANPFFVLYDWTIIKSSESLYRTVHSGVGFTASPSLCTIHIGNADTWPVVTMRQPSNNCEIREKSKHKQPSWRRSAVSRSRSWSGKRARVACEREFFSIVVLTSRGSTNARERKCGSWFVEEPPKVVVVVVCGCSFCEEI